MALSMPSSLPLATALLAAACSRHTASQPTASGAANPARAANTNSAIGPQLAPEHPASVQSAAQRDPASAHAEAPGTTASTDWPPWRRPGERLEPTCANAALELGGGTSRADVSGVIAEVLRTFPRFHLQAGASPEPTAFALTLEADAGVVRVRCGDALTCERFGALVELADPEQVAHLRCAAPSSSARRLGVGANGSRAALCARLRACEVRERRSLSDCDDVELSGVRPCAAKQDCGAVLSCVEQRTEQARERRPRNPNLPQPSPQKPGKLPPGVEY